MNRRVALASALSATAVAGTWAIWTRGTNSSPRAGQPHLTWAFEAPLPGAVIAAPLVTLDAVFLSIVHVKGLGLSGAVYAIDPSTGRERWCYDHDGDMLPSASAPIQCGDTLMFGEGMHANFTCRLHAVDVNSGVTRWTFPTTDHIECGPLVMGDRVFISAGNDGIYAIDVATGRRLWQYHADFHADCTPVHADGLLFIGTGPSRRFQTNEVIALDVNSGVPRWRTPVPWPAWSSPVLLYGRVYFGLGNGRLMVPPPPTESSVGGLVCLSTEDGQIRWQTPFDSAVFARPLLVDRLILAGARDGHLYALDRGSGREQYRVPMGGPVMTDAVTDGSRVFVVSANGRICSIDPRVGREVWRLELSDVAKSEVRVFAPPRYADRRLFVGAEVKTGGAGVATLVCIQIPAE